VQKLLLTIIAVLSLSTAVHAEPSQAVKDWLPQLDKNIEDINALMKAGGKTGRYHREGYTIVVADEMTSAFRDGLIGLIKTDPARARSILRKVAQDQICSNKFGDLLDMDLAIELRLKHPTVPLSTTLRKGDCASYPRS
jgi:hypothetical protein